MQSIFDAYQSSNRWLHMWPNVEGPLIRSNKNKNNYFFLAKKFVKRDCSLIRSNTVYAFTQRFAASANCIISVFMSGTNIQCDRLWRSWTQALYYT